MDCGVTPLDILIALKKFEGEITGVHWGNQTLCSIKNMITKAQIKIIRSLHNQKGRKEHNKFIIEGSRLIKEALKANYSLSQLYVTLEFSTNHQELLDNCKNTAVEINEIPEQELNVIADTESPSGIIGVSQIPKKMELNTVDHNHVLYLDHVSDPGNMGTLLRTASWFGIEHIALSPNCVDIYNPKVVRSGMGAHFYIHFHTNVSLNELAPTHTIIGADHHGDSRIEGVGPPIALVLGSEAHGISKENQKFIQQYISIPKMGNGESLNVAVAGGILMEKLFTQK